MSDTESVISRASRASLVVGIGVGGDDSSEERDKTSLLSYLRSAIDSTSAGFLNVLYIMTKTATSSVPLDDMHKLIQCLSMIALVLPHPDRLNFDAEPSVTCWAKVMSVFGPVNPITKHSPNISLIVASVLVIGVVVIGIYVGRVWTSLGPRHVWLIRMLRKWSNLLTTILYVPVLGIFTNALNCSEGFMAEYCFWLRPTVFMLTVGFVGLAAVVTGVVFESNPTRQYAPSSRPHARLDLCSLLLTTIMTLAYTLVLPESVVSSGVRSPMLLRLIWAGMSVSFWSFLSYAWLFYQPYYSSRSNEVRVILMAQVLWSAVLGPCALVTFQSDISIAPTLFMGYLLVPPIALLCVRSRHEILSTRAISACQNVFEVELRCRFEGPKNNISDRDLEEIQQYFLSALDLFPNSAFIHIFHAMFLQHLKCAPLQSRRSLMRAESLGLFFDQSFFLMREKRQLEEDQRSGISNPEVMSYVMTEKYLQETLQNDKKCCVTLMEFWTIAGSRRPDIKRISSLSSAIATQIADANRSYIQLLTHQPKSPKGLATYAGFLEVIIKDTIRASQLAIRAQRAKATANWLQLGNGEAAINEHTANITVVATETDLPVGAIVSVNDKAQALLGPNLFGHDIGNVLLPPYSMAFPAIIESYLDKGKDAYFRRQLDAVCKTSRGKLLPSVINMQPYSADGVNFVIFISILPKQAANISSNGMILADSASGTVHSLTPEAISLFQLTDEEVETGGVTMKSLIRDFAELRTSALESDTGQYHEASIQVSRSPGDSAELQVAIQTLEIEGYSTDFIHVMDCSRLPTRRESGIKVSLQKPIRLTNVRNRYSDEISSTENVLEFLGADDQDISVGQSSENLHMPQLSSLMSPVAYEDLNDDQCHKRKNSVSITSKRSVNFSPETIEVDEFSTSQSSLIWSPRPGTKENVETLTEQSDEESLHDRATDISDMSNVTGSSSSNAARSIRRSLLIAGQTMDPSLKNFRKLFVSILILLISMSIAVYVWKISVMDVYQSRLHLARQCGMRRLYAVDMGYRAHSLLLAKLNISVPLYDEKTTRESLTNSATRLLAIDLAIYNYYTMLTDAEADPYQNKKTRLRKLVHEPDLVHGGVTTATSIGEHSLYESTVIMTSAAFQLAKTPLEYISRESDTVFMLMANIVGSHSYLNSLNASTTALSKYAEGVTNSYATDAIEVDIGCVLILTILVVWCLLPTAKSIVRAKRRIIKLLVDLPKDIVIVILSEIASRLEGVHGVASFDLEKANVFASKTPKKVADQFEQLETGNLLDENRASQNRFESSPKRVVNLRGRVRWMSIQCAKLITADETYIMIRVASIIAIQIVFLSLDLSQDRSVEPILAETPVDQYLSSQRLVETQMALHYIRMLADGVAFGGVEEITQIDLDSTMNVISGLAFTHDQLMYGRQGLVGLLQRKDLSSAETSIQFKLMMSSACNSFTSSNFAHVTNADCVKFEGGLLARGLHTGMMTFVSMATSVVKMIDASLVTQRNQEFVPQGRTGVWTQVPDAFLSEYSSSYETLLALGELYLLPPLFHSADLYGRRADTSLEESLMLQKYLLLGFIFVILSAYYLLIRSLIVSLDTDGKRTRMLLLLIPEDRLDQLTNLKEILK